MTISVEPPPERRRMSRATLAWVAVVVLVVAGGAWWWLGQDDDEPPQPEPLPAPTATPTQQGMTAEQATALVYYDWLRWRQVAECFTEAGYPREPYLRYEIDLVPRVANFLQIEAVTTDPDLPTPDFRWAELEAPGDPDDPPSRRLTDPTAPDNCLPDAPALRVSDDTTLVDSAREDDAFLTALGEYAWAAENPGRIQLATARVMDPPGVTTTDADVHAEWEELLSEMATILAGELVVTGSETTDQYAQLGAVTRDGDGAIVRIALPGYGLSPDWDARERARCGALEMDVASSDMDGDMLVSGTTRSAVCQYVRGLDDVPGESGGS